MILLDQSIHRMFDLIWKTKALGLPPDLLVLYIPDPTHDAFTVQWKI